MADGFCVGPGTLVAVRDGWKRVEEVKPGDALRHGHVEGVLKTTGGGKCIRINGVVISESHLVYEDGWKLASQHTAAEPAESPDSLYCLNTTEHTWIVKSDGPAEELVLRDWEELPDGNDSMWEQLIHEMLNEPAEPVDPLLPNPGRGTFDKDAMVWERRRGPIRISEARVGDSIKDNDGYTDVLGFYSDVEANIGALWFMDPKGGWNHPPFYEKQTAGFHLITSSGKYTVFIGKDEFCVRDFTEVGVGRISETYPLTLSLLAANNRNA
jgi:hypothetical protein